MKPSIINWNEYFSDSENCVFPQTIQTVLAKQLEMHQKTFSRSSQRRLRGRTHKSKQLANVIRNFSKDALALALATTTTLVEQNNLLFAWTSLPLPCFTLSAILLPSHGGNTTGKHTQGNAKTMPAILRCCILCVCHMPWILRVLHTVKPSAKLSPFIYWRYFFFKSEALFKVWMTSKCCCLC